MTRFIAFNTQRERLRVHETKNPEHGVSTVFQILIETKNVVLRGIDFSDRKTRKRTKTENTPEAAGAY